MLSIRPLNTCVIPLPQRVIAVSLALRQRMVQSSSPILCLEYPRIHQQYVFCHSKPIRRFPLSVLEGSALNLISLKAPPYVLSIVSHVCPNPCFRQRRRIAILFPSALPWTAEFTDTSSSPCTVVARGVPSASAAATRSCTRNSGEGIHIVVNDVAVVCTLNHRHSLARDELVILRCGPRRQKRLLWTGVW